jgi:hypothetical protein
VVNARFTALCAHYLSEPDFCNVASGWEKGVVEKNVQDGRRRIWIDAAEAHEVSRKAGAIHAENSGQGGQLWSAVTRSALRSTAKTTVALK